MITPMENAISSFPPRQHHKISVSGLISTFFSKKMLCIIITREGCTKNLKMGFFTPSPTATICDKKCASHYNSLSCKNYPLLQCNIRTQFGSSRITKEDTVFENYSKKSPWSVSSLYWVFHQVLVTNFAKKL